MENADGKTWPIVMIGRRKVVRYYGNPEQLILRDVELTVEELRRKFGFPGSIPHNGENIEEFVNSVIEKISIFKKVSLENVLREFELVYQQVSKN